MSEDAGLACSTVALTPAAFITILVACGVVVAAICSILCVILHRARRTIGKSGYGSLNCLVLQTATRSLSQELCCCCCPSTMSGAAGPYQKKRRRGRGGVAVQQQLQGASVALAQADLATLEAELQTLATQQAEGGGGPELAGAVQLVEGAIRQLRRELGLPEPPEGNFHRVGPKFAS
jgi:hypothetical protein